MEAPQTNGASLTDCTTSPDCLLFKLTPRTLAKSSGKGHHWKDNTVIWKLAFYARINIKDAWIRTGKCMDYAWIVGTQIMWYSSNLWFFFFRKSKISTLYACVTFASVGSTLCEITSLHAHWHLSIVSVCHCALSKIGFAFCLNSPLVCRSLWLCQSMFVTMILRVRYAWNKPNRKRKVFILVPNGHTWRQGNKPDIIGSSRCITLPSWSFSIMAFGGFCSLDSGLFKC